MRRRRQQLDSANRSGAGRLFSQGFTLVEMLVSVALIAVLMLSVTEIFAIATRTIGGGQAISAAVRDAQAAQEVMSQDFAAAASDSAAFVIRMMQTPAFRSNADYIGSINPANPLADIDANGAALNYSPLTYNYRNHRLDYLMFFARDRFYRQTGNGTDLIPGASTIIADMSANEAAIYYHHVALPYPDNSFYLAGTAANGPTNPGKDIRLLAGHTTDDPVAANPNNFFASQWILGRSATLLVAPSLRDPTDPLYNATTYSVRSSDGTNQAFYGYDTAIAGSPLSGLSKICTAGTGPSPSPLTLNYVTPARVMQDARLDVAGTSIKTFATQLDTSVANWWLNLLCDTRLHVNPFVIKPITPATASQQVPIFLPAATQFIVEFAGDYVSQNWDPDGDGTPDTVADKANANYGQVLVQGQDGRIDTVGSTGQIRWYGLPRDTTGDGRIRGVDGDVVPLRDVVNSAAAPPATPQAGYPKQVFEKVLPTAAAQALTVDYLTLAAVTATPEYTVAWGPDSINDKTQPRPKLMRVTIVIDRPEGAGNLLDGQTFEYVFKVGL